MVGLRGGHSELDVSISMEMVYNGFAISSWPLFLLLNRFWSKNFQEKPNRFDLYCHGLMGLLVYMRIMTCDQKDLIVSATPSIIIAIAGYALFNISIKLSNGHRATNITMNMGGGTLLLVYATILKDIGHWDWDPIFIGGFILGAIGIFMLVRELGQSYIHFGHKGQASIVSPLVYDGILVGSPLVTLITDDMPDEWLFIIPIAFGMLLMTMIRYRHHCIVATITTK
ncbi:MAG: hypothetical protein GF349_01065 [Candidatus Magasanikbacteria bacterium]|nr:hypothetical protein [Candidatus Magasanikbacteria bacterium]